MRKALELDEDQIVKDYQGGMSMKSIGLSLGISLTPIERVLKAKGIISKPKGMYRSCTLNEYFFEIVDTEAKAYWLGFMYADGYNSEKYGSIQITLMEDDKYILEQFKKDLGYSGNLHLSWSGQKSSYIDGRELNAKPRWGLSISSRRLSEDLKRHGCMQAKSKILQFPEVAVPKELAHHFIRGYFDGDGSICIHKKEKFKSFMLYGNLDFLIGTQVSLVKGAGLRYTKIVPKTGVSMLSYGGTLQIDRIFNYLYKDATIYLTRKYNKFLE